MKSKILVTCVMFGFLNFSASADESEITNVDVLKVRDYRKGGKMLYIPSQNVNLSSAANQLQINNICFPPGDCAADFVVKDFTDGRLFYRSSFGNEFWLIRDEVGFNYSINNFPTTEGSKRYHQILDYLKGERDDLRRSVNILKIIDNIAYVGFSNSLFLVDFPKGFSDECRSDAESLSCARMWKRIYTGYKGRDFRFDI